MARRRQLVGSAAAVLILVALLALGRPIEQAQPLKPGVTFFEVVSFESSWDPVARIIRFHNPPLPTLTMTLTPTPTATITPSATESAVPPTGTATP